MLMQWDWLNDQLRHTLNPLYYTPMGAFMRDVAWAWPAFESIHFIGMSLLMGTIGVLDLRLLGFPRAVPVSALQGLVPLGAGGFLLTLVTGIFFVCGSPDQFLFSAAFRWKVVFVLIAGLNILFFYTRRFRFDAMYGRTPLLARLVAVIALAACLGAISAGRLATGLTP